MSVLAVAAVQVAADTSGFRQDLRRKLERSIRTAIRDVERDIWIGRALSGGVGRDAQTVGINGWRAGDQFSWEFAARAVPGFAGHQLAASLAGAERDAWLRGAVPVRGSLAASPARGGQDTPSIAADAGVMARW